MQLRTEQTVSPAVPNLADETWTPVKPSRGLLDPPLRSRAASTGFIVQDDTLVGFASRVEKFAAESFALDPNVTFFREQWPRVDYRDGTGKWCRHVFDYFVVERERRKCVAIKHSKRVEKSAIREILRSIAAQVGRKVADDVVLMTERNFSPNQRHNAELVHELRRHPMPEHDERVRSVAAELIGAVTIEDVVNLAGLGADGFRATVRLLADQFFRLSNGADRIDYATRIYRA